MEITSAGKNLSSVTPHLLLGDDDAYQNWRKRKLDDQPRHIEELIVDINSLTDIEPEQRSAIAHNCQRANMVIYRCRDKAADTRQLRAFGASFGLTRLDHHLCTEEDGVSELTVAESGARADSKNRRKGEFIPYSNRRLGWHTDGYYNAPGDRIRTLLLHCVRPAAEGGENALMDPEITYILLRDENPAFITALMHHECMTIPAFDAGEDTSRPARAGPVFGIDSLSGALYMRYTARTRNIVWRDDPVTEQAVAFLGNLLASDNAAIFRARLGAGEGLLCNNVLHKRTAFEDDPEQKRLLYRARYFDPITHD